MNQANQAPASKQHWDEPDIGSGEKTPAQHETEEIIRQIPPLPDDGSGNPRQDPSSSKEGKEEKAEKAEKEEPAPPETKQAQAA
ncbi:MAG TPA: hypothetical protein VGP06_08470 [Janthinobacterium sp.]|nr:hypothetical protein [Janthinobacterium sp.]